ncbi:MAG: protein BatD [Halanaerobiales bacterium]|nr:protein BatD [Halanaerobiales bacterium]
MWRNFTIPKLFLIGLVMIFLISLPVCAKDTQVNAFVNEKRIEIGQTLTLTVEIKENTNVPAPDIEIEDFKVQYRGPRTQVSIVNGSRSSSIQHIFSVIPLKTGDLMIPPIEIKINGRKYQTQSIDVTVVERGQSGNQTIDDQLRELTFLEVELKRNKIYLNEEIPIMINFYYHKDLELSNIYYPELESSNFLIQPFSEPEKNMTLINGQYFNFIPFKTTIRPISRGDYKIGPVVLKTEVAIPRRNNYNGFNSFFGNNYDIYPFNVLSDEINIQIMDYPKEEKPLDFNGAVGRFKMDVTATPEKVKVGEPITIKMKVTGEGSLNTVSAPIIEENSDFKYYNPQVLTTKDGDSYQAAVKIFEQVIIPTNAVNTLPKISFSYFDPFEEKYHTLEAGPLSIKVMGSGESVGQIADYRDNKTAAKILGQDIVFIKSEPKTFSQHNKTLLTTSGYLGYNLIVLGLLLGGVFLKLMVNKKPETRKRREIIAKTLQLLCESERLLKEGHNDQFYNTIYQGIQNCLKECFQITITGISDYEAEHLKKAGISLEMLDQIKDFYHEMDLKRFAGSFSDETEMKKILTKAREIIATIEKGEVA